MIHLLTSDKLTVEITSPGSAPNDGFRFDRSSYITEVTLNDGTRFCASEPRNLSHPSSNGRGFCACNRFDASMEVDVGEYFPVIGIGLLKKPTEKKYSQFLRYDEGFIPFEIKEEYTADSAVFEIMPMPCNGYAFHEKRVIRVEGDKIYNTVTLENVGDKPITVMEYGHNFISIEGMAVGPDYVITMPQIPDLTGIEQVEAERGGPTNFEGYGHGFKMKQYESQSYSVALDDYAFYKGEPFVWRVANTAAGAYVEGTDDIKLSRVKIWTCDHMVCPEIYQNITIQPGQSATWSRDLKFGRL